MNSWSRSRPLIWVRRPSSMRGEGVLVEVVGHRVGAEPRDAGHLRDVPHDVGGERLLRAGLGEVEARAVGQPHAQRDRATCPGASRCWAARRTSAASPARARWKTRWVPSTSRSRNLPWRRHAVDRGPGERGRRRVEGLEHREGRQLDAGHGQPGGALGEEVDERLHLGQLRHVALMPPGRAQIAEVGAWARSRARPRRACRRGEDLERGRSRRGRSRPAPRAARGCCGAGAPRWRPGGRATGPARWASAGGWRWRRRPRAGPRRSPGRSSGRAGRRRRRGSSGCCGKSRASRSRQARLCSWPLRNQPVLVGPQSVSSSGPTG